MSLILVFLATFLLNYKNKIKLNWIFIFLLSCFRAMSIIKSALQIILILNKLNSLHSGEKELCAAQHFTFPLLYPSWINRYLFLMILEVPDCHLQIRSGNQNAYRRNCCKMYLRAFTLTTDHILIGLIAYVCFCA